MTYLNPISAAPKTGQKLVGFRECQREYAIIRWLKHLKVTYVADEHGGYTRVSEERGCWIAENKPSSRPFEPTHWSKLPVLKAAT